MTEFQAYVPSFNLHQLAPFLVLLAGGLATLVADALTNKEGSRRVLPVITFVSLAAAAAALLFRGAWGDQIAFAEGSLRGSSFAVLGSVTICLGMLVMTVLGPSTVLRRNLPSGEYYTLILFATLGMTMLSFANELVTAFICIEIISLSMYVLAGIDRRSPRSAEAAFKYFILGAFASAFFVMGVAFLYGATGTTRLDAMYQVFLADARPLLTGGTEPLNGVWVYFGFALAFVGLCFKLSLAPFHMWAPDVYEGAPTSTAMAIATAGKVGVFALLYHMLIAMAPWKPFYEAAGFLFMFVAVASMLWGNIAALTQTNIKRMLAYSSIAHGGYMMVGFVALMSLPAKVSAVEVADFQAEISDALVVYLFGYTLMNILAFGLAHYLGRGGEGHMRNYAGLWKRNPVAASAMALAMFGLVGFPPTVGFIGKFYVFQRAIEQGLFGLAVIGVLASVISAFYYLQLVVTMFMRDEQEAGAVEAELAGTTPAQAVPLGRVLALGVAAGLIFLAGLQPMIFLAMGLF